MNIRRFRAAAGALALLVTSLFGTGPASADAVQTTPMQPAFALGIDACRAHGQYLGTGLYRVGGGQNMVVVEVCGDAGKHDVRAVAASYLKVSGPRAAGLRLHWRWADAAGTVHGGGDDDRAPFALDPQSQNTVAWAYSRPVTAQDPGAPCLVGVLSQGGTQFVTEPVCP